MGQALVPQMGPDMDTAQLNSMQLPAWLENDNTPSMQSQEIAATDDSDTPSARLKKRMGLTETPESTPVQKTNDADQMTPSERLMARLKDVPTESAPSAPQTPSQTPLDPNLDDGESSRSARRSALKNGITTLEDSTLRGMQDLGDTLSPVLAKGALEAKQLMGGPQAPSFQDLRAQQADDTRDALADYDSKYAGNKLAMVGRMAGNAVGSAGPLKAAGLGIDALASAAPSIAPVAEFLSGNQASNSITGPAGNAIRNSTMGNKILQVLSQATGGAGAGAGATALISGGSPDTPFSQQEKLGAATGGIVAPLAPMIAKSVAGGAGAVQNFFQKAPVQMQNKLIEALGRDGIQPHEVENRLQQMGPEATVADLGPNTKALVESMANTPGKGKAAATEFFGNRQDEQSGRLVQKVKDGLGVDPSKSFDQVVTDLDEKRAAAAAPIYKEVYPKRIPPNLVTSMANKNPLIDKAIKSAGNDDVAQHYIAKYEQETGQKIEENSVGYLDAVKKSLDGKASAAYSSGNTAAGNAYSESARQLRGEIDGYVPRYAEARAAYAGPSQSIEAAENGRNFVKNGVNMTKAQVSKLSDSDKELYRLGAADELEKQIKTTSYGGDAVKKILGSPAKREALEALWPSKESFADFEKAIEHESTMFETGTDVLKNSRTFSREAAARDAGSVGLGDLYHGGRAVMGDQSSLMRLGGKLISALTPSKNMSPQQSEALADLVLGQDRLGSARSLVQHSAPGQKSNRLLNYMDALSKNVLPAASAQIGNKLYVHVTPDDAR